MAAHWTVIIVCILSLDRRYFVTTVVQFPRDLYFTGVPSCGHKNRINDSVCQALPPEASLTKGPKQANSVLINIYTHAEMAKKLNIYNLTRLPVLQDTTEQNLYASIGPVLIYHVLLQCKDKAEASACHSTRLPWQPIGRYRLRKPPFTPLNPLSPPMNTPRDRKSHLKSSSIFKFWSFHSYPKMLQKGRVLCPRKNPRCDSLDCIPLTLFD